VLGVGTRTSREVVYPVSELAQRHRAGVTRETPDPDQAYADTAPDQPTAYRDGWLPG